MKQRTETRAAVWCGQRALWAAMVCVAAGCGESGDSTALTEWPPRLRNLDALATAVPEDATLSWTIDSDDPLRWTGEQELRGRRFFPVEDKFTVSGGTLVSRLGAIEKRAKFGGWQLSSRSDGWYLGNKRHFER